MWAAEDRKALRDRCRRTEASELVVVEHPGGREALGTPALAGSRPVLRAVVVVAEEACRQEAGEGSHSCNKQTKRRRQYSKCLL